MARESLSWQDFGKAVDAKQQVDEHPIEDETASQQISETPSTLSSTSPH
jgi:hypothetical protein